MSGYSSESRVDMLLLADRVRAVPDVAAPPFAAGLITLGVMRTNRVLHWAVRFGRWRSGCDEFTVWLRLFERRLERRPDTARALIANAATWIANGKDSTSPKSAGGLNASEVRRVVGLLNAVDRALEVEA